MHNLMTWIIMAEYTEESIVVDSRRARVVQHDVIASENEL